MTAVDDAIARGQETAAALVRARDGLFEHMRAILPIAGREGLRACVLGVQVAVLNEYPRRPDPAETPGRTQGD